MKVLLCHNPYRYRGGEDQVFEDERWLLRENGHEVISYCRHNDTVTQMGRLALAANTLWSRDVYREVRELVRDRRPDLMHCTNTFPLISPSVYAAAKSEGVPVVQSLHNFRLLCPGSTLLRREEPCESCVGKTIPWPGVWHRCYRGSASASAVVAAMLALHWRKGTWASAVDRYIALTEFSRRKFIQGGLPAERMASKPNFVRVDPGFGSGAGDYAVFVGRLAPEKGISTLLEAWRHPAINLRLVLVGQGPLEHLVTAAAAENPRIDWRGQVPFSEVLSVIGSSRVLIMPSVWYETFGRSIIEAFSTGTPVVASRMGAMEELIEDGRTGMLFEPGNAEDLVAKVTEVCRSEERLQKMRHAARDRYLDAYTPERNYQILTGIYSQVLGGQLAR